MFLRPVDKFHASVLTANHGALGLLRRSKTSITPLADPTFTPRPHAGNKYIVLGHREREREREKERERERERENNIAGFTKGAGQRHLGTGRGMYLCTFGVLLQQEVLSLLAIDVY